MTFGLLPVLGVLGGLAVLAGVLFALQRLRVRHREITVVTTLFWHEAVEEARARVLTGRFRHPWAYVLALLICALLWTSFAEPHFDAADGRDHLVVLDGSAAMGVQERFDDARDAVESVTTGLPRDRTTVVFAGGSPRTLLRADEEAHLLRARIDTLQAELCPPQVVNVIRDWLPTSSEQRPLTVHVVGDADLSSLGALPGWVEVVRAEGAAPTLRDNRGITSIGVSDAASGAYDRVDVLVEARGAGLEAADVDVTHGDPLTPTATTRPSDGVVRLLFQDVPANGTPVEARLTDDDGFAADDVASVTIPNRPLIQVALVGTAAERLRPVLAADSAVKLVADQAEASVVISDQASMSSRATLWLVPATEQDDAIMVRPAVTDFDGATSPASIMRETHHALALSEIDAASLAETAQREIRLGIAAVDGPRRAISMWNSLLTDRFDLIHSRAYPVFIARAVRWLADAPELVPYAAAGQPLMSAGTPLIPAVAGDLTLPGSQATLSISLVDVATTQPWTGADAVPAASTSGTGGRLATILLLIALVLLGAEWVLFRTGPMP